LIYVGSTRAKGTVPSGYNNEVCGWDKKEVEAGEAKVDNAIKGVESNN
jgi:hypothetical protein